MNTTGNLPNKWINDTPNPFGNWPDWSPAPLPFSNPVGWQCPICGTVYAPTIMTCFKKHRKPRKPKVDKT